METEEIKVEENVETKKISPEDNEETRNKSNIFLFSF